MTPARSQSSFDKKAKEADESEIDKLNALILNLERRLKTTKDQYMTKLIGCRLRRKRAQLAKLDPAFGVDDESETFDNLSTTSACGTPPRQKRARLAEPESTTSQPRRERASEFEICALQKFLELLTSRNERDKESEFDRLIASILEVGRRLKATKDQPIMAMLYGKLLRKKRERLAELEPELKLFWGASDTANRQRAVET